MSPRARQGRFPELATGTPLVPDERLRPLIDRHLDAGSPSGWFEPAYLEAVVAQRRLPWQEADAHPWVASWLDDPVLTPPGRRALVVGCATGAEVRLLAGHGFEVVGLDVSPTALAWAADLLRREPRAVRRGVSLVEADLLGVDPAELGTFDLVVEVHTVPWLPGLVQDAAMAAIGPLVAPGGVAVTITELRRGDAAEVTGPPWPQAPSALAAYRAGGLVRLALEHPRASLSGPLEVRLSWQRPRTPDDAAPDAGPTIGR